MPVVSGASVPCSLFDAQAFLLSNNADNQKQQLKLPARVYCFALSQLLIRYLSRKEVLSLRITNPAIGPDYDKHAGQSAIFYWGTVDKRLGIAKWVLTVSFDPTKDFEEQPCTLENWTCVQHFTKQESMQVFCVKRSLEVFRLLYMLGHPLDDFAKMFPMLEPAEKDFTRFDDVVQGKEPWISEWAKK